MKLKTQFRNLPYTLDKSLRALQTALLLFSVVILLTGCDRKAGIDANAPVEVAPSSNSSESVTPPTPTPVPEEPQDSGKSVTDPTVKKATDKTKPLPKMVDLGADKCRPCKMMAPILVELRKEYAGKVDVIFIDVWKDPAPGKQAGIRVIPTQIFYNADGKELFRHEGYFSKDEILAKWRELGFLEN